MVGKRRAFPPQTLTLPVQLICLPLILKGHNWNPFFHMAIDHLIPSINFPGVQSGAMNGFARGRIAKVGHGLPKVSPRPPMPYPFKPCGRANLKTAFSWPFQDGPHAGQVACGRLLPFWTPHAYAYGFAGNPLESASRLTWHRHDGHPLFDFGRANTAETISVGCGLSKELDCRRPPSLRADQP
jgi:hypothetical protein